MPKTLHVGVDVALKTLAACFVDDEGKALHTIKSMPNTPAGARQIQQQIARLCQQDCFQLVRVGTEATSVYDLHVLEYLLEAGPGAPVPLSLYRINPRLIKHFKLCSTEGSKTDAIDAFFIADYVRFKPLLRPYSTQSALLPLQRLTRFRRSIVKNIAAETNRLLATIFLHMPGIVQQKPMDPSAPTMAAITGEYLTPEQLLATPLEELAALVAGHARNGVDPDAAAQAIREAVTDSFRITPALADALRLIEAASVANIRALKKSLESIDAQIEKSLAAFPNTLRTVKGIGPVFAAGLIAEIGDIRNYVSPDKLAKRAGLVWNQRQSGPFAAEDTHLTTTANRHLRYYLVEAANSLRIHNEEYARYYQRKFNEVRDHQHRRALVLTARKFVRLVFALLKDGRIYLPNRASQQP